MVTIDGADLALAPEVVGMIQAVARRAGIADGVGYLGREDVLSELMLVALQAEPLYDPTRGKFTTFVWKRLWGRAVDLRRRHGRQLRDGQPRPVEVGLEEAESLEDGSPSASDGSLMHAISRLPGRERAALLMRDVGGVPAADVGRVLGIGKSQAKDLRRQAVRRLHVAFRPAGGRPLG